MLKGVFELGGEGGRWKRAKEVGQRGRGKGGAEKERIKRGEVKEGKQMRRGKERGAKSKGEKGGAKEKGQRERVKKVEQGRRGK